MITAEATLILDLGNSESRVATLYGKNKDGSPRLLVSKISNRFSALPAGYVIPEEYQNDDTIVFTHGGVEYASGELSDREFAVAAVRPSALQKKYESLSTELSIRAAFLEGYRHIAEITGSDLGDLDIRWRVTALIPPADTFIGAPLLAAKIKEVTELSFRNPDFQTQIEIVPQGVSIRPEGLTAFMGVVFNVVSRGKANPGMATLLQETVLVIDVGAGTTDFCVVKDARIIEDTKDTVETGGNNVHSQVRRDLKRDGLALPDDTVREGSVSGEVRDGSKTVDITALVNKAKETTASVLVNSIRDFFESSQFPARSLAKVLIVGGGSLASANEKILPLSEYILRYLTSIAPNIELVDIPEIQVQAVDGLFDVTSRDLNLVGAIVLSSAK